MSDKDHNRYIKLLLISWFLFLLLLTGVVVFFSWHLQEMATENYKQSTQIVDHSEQIKINSDQLDKLQDLVQHIAEQAKIPGPQGLTGNNGIDGRDGTDSLSTHTEVVREVAVKGDKGDPLTFEDLTEEQKAELKAEPALQIELCKWRDKLEIGWRYIGTTLCLPIEVIDL